MADKGELIGEWHCELPGHNCLCMELHKDAQGNHHFDFHGGSMYGFGIRMGTKRVGEDFKRTIIEMYEKIKDMTPEEIQAKIMAKTDEMDWR